MKNICLILEYLGTNYCGFQKQKNGKAIQQVLEDAILAALGEQVATTASGRTDAGVHALGQVVSFKTNSAIPPEKIAVVINQKLPQDISIKKSYEVPENFNARFSAKNKTYAYSVCFSDYMPVLRRGRHLHYPYKVDINKMRAAARCLKGEHDFSSFMASGGNAGETTVRQIYKIKIKDELFGGILLGFYITGNGFLYNMVRIIVGTLLEIGQGKLPVDTIKKMLNGAPRETGGKTVGPEGLYLVEVKY